MKNNHIVECPHCHFRVLPSEQGICPSCLRNIHDLSDTNPNLTSMVIPDTMQLPAVCYLCNIPTDRRVRVVNRYDLDKEPTLLNFLSSMILVFQSRVYYSEYGDMDGTSPTVAITLSQCKACSKKGKPKPVYVDFENMAMTFIVHKGFKQRAMETATEKE